MNSQWQIDLFTGLENAVDMQDVLDVTLKSVKPLGFDYCGWRSKLPVPLSEHRFSVLSSNEDRISELRQLGNYDDVPVVKHCSKSTEPIHWQGTTDDPIFSKAPELWEEYYSVGHFGGWAQSIIESKNMFSMMHVDSRVPLSQKDLDNVDLKLQWIAVAVLAKMNKMRLVANIVLSKREKEILKWFGDGKTSEHIGMILNLSHSTINFHFRNAMRKLGTHNKTSTVVKAIYLNLLH